MQARAKLTTCWGTTPVAVIATCALAAIRRLARRPACSVVGRSLRWRSAADMEAVAVIQKGRKRECSRHPRQRREDPPRQFACDYWWMGAAGCKRRQVAIALTSGAQDGWDGIRPE